MGDQSQKRRKSRCVGHTIFKVTLAVVPDGKNGVDFLVDVRLGGPHGNLLVRHEDLARQLPSPSCDTNSQLISSETLFLCSRYL